MSNKESSDDWRRYRRTPTEKIKCFFGFHDWGEPYVMETKLGITGEKSQGEWDIEVDENPDNNAHVQQYCQRPRCHGTRERPNLSVEEYRYDSDQQ